MVIRVKLAIISLGNSQGRFKTFISYLIIWVPTIR
jgi:hypothetical protein